MYSEEIKRLLILKKNLITTEEYQRILTTSPQIQSIKYNTFTNEFEISTSDNYTLSFNVERKKEMHG